MPRSAPSRAAADASREASTPATPTPITNPTPNLFAGTSGWAYPSWKPGFYTAKTPARAFLNFYASQLTSVEVNYTFRTLPTATQLQGWLDATPAHFRFSFKAPQRITHFQRLRDSAAEISAFFAAIEPAYDAGKLGPLLFQLPPNFAADNERLSAFLEAARAAETFPVQLAFEFRNLSWFADDTYALLRHYNTALCVAESNDLSTPEIATADFRCYRLRRNGGYSPAKIKAFAKRFQDLAATAPTYVYFKHEDEPTGALNAQAMLKQAARLLAGGR